MKRKDWYSELNLVVAKIFVANNVEGMLLADLKRELMSHADVEHLNECYFKLINVENRDYNIRNFTRGDWRFYDFDDRFVNNLKHAADFEIVKRDVAGRMRRFVVRK